MKSKVYCLNCEYYSIGEYGGCNCHEIYTDTWQGRFYGGEESVLNKKNSCKYYLKRLSLIEKLKRFLTTPSGKER